MNAYCVEGWLLISVDTKSGMSTPHCVQIDCEMKSFNENHFKAFKSVILHHINDTKRLIDKTSILYFLIFEINNGITEFCN